MSLSYANYNDNTTFNITVSEGKFEILNVNTEKTPHWVLREDLLIILI